MADEPDPPRKIYGLKSKEDFDRTNVPYATKSDQPTSVYEHLSLADEKKSLAPANPASVVPKGPPSPDEIKAVLKRNLEADKAAGLYDLKPIVDTKKEKRKTQFWYPIVITDAIMAGVAIVNWHHMDLLVVLFLSFGFLINVFLIWITWAFRTD